MENQQPQESQPTKLNKAVRICIIIVGALLVVLLVAYCLATYVPQKDRAKTEQQAQQAATQLQQQEAQQAVGQQTDNQQSNDSYLQSKCSLMADIFFQEYFQGESTENATQINRWNSTLNKCFIEISFSTVDSTGTTTSYDFFDVSDRREYGYMMIELKLNSRSGQMCVMNPDSTGNADSKGAVPCKSKAEFDNFVKSYMVNDSKAII